MFVQCEKLRETGLEVKLSTSPPYVQIFHCQPSHPSFSSPPPPLPPPAQFEDRKPPHHMPHISGLPPPSSSPYADCRVLPSQTLAAPGGGSGDYRIQLQQRPLLASSQSLNPIRIPVAPPMPAVIPPSHQLHLPSNEPVVSSNKHHSGFSIGNWRGSMESLVQKTGVSSGLQVF